MIRFSSLFAAIPAFLFGTLDCQRAGAQLFDRSNNRLPAAYAGLGIGLDYGGIGIRMELYPVKYLSTFVGLGLNSAGFGFNTGLSVKFLPDRRATPYLCGMWGYNAVLHYAGGIQPATVYHGFTVGAGAEIFVGQRRNKVSLGLLFPFRDQEFKDRASLVSPVGLSAGFCFAIGGTREHRR